METNEQTKKLRSLPITISGGWLENPKYKWNGSAISSEPIVAVVFLQRGNTIEWCKSSSSSSKSLEVALWISRYNEIDLEVQVGLSVGNADRRFASFLESANYKPDIKVEITANTGEILKFTEVEGEPKISFCVVLLARSDVKFGRNSIWHLRKDINTVFSDEVKRILENGRVGRYIMEKVL